MKFLCLHGMGTNSRILESQIAGICARLEGHDFVFVDGQVECDAADGMHSHLVENFPADCPYVQKLHRFFQDHIFATIICQHLTY